MGRRLIPVAVFVLGVFIGAGCSKSADMPKTTDIKPPTPAPGVGKKMGVQNTNVMPSPGK